MTTAATVTGGSVLFIVLVVIAAYVCLAPYMGIHTGLPDIVLFDQTHYTDNAEVALKNPVGEPISDHGFRMHHDEEVRSQECGRNPLHTLWNPATNRYVDICKDSLSKWAMFIYQIIDGFKREVTAFERPQATTMNDVIDYVKSTGYTRNPIIPK